VGLLLHIGTWSRLLLMSHLISGVLHLKVGPLHLELLPLYRHRWMDGVGRSEERTELRWYPGSGVATRRLSLGGHLPLVILFYLLEVDLNDDGLIHQLLKIFIVSVEQLELDIVIDSFQKHVMLLIGIDFIWGILGQLSEPVEVLVHGHAILSKIGELLLPQLDSAMGHVVRSETSLEFIPRDGFYIIVGIAISLPPVHGGSKKLMCYEKNLLMIATLGDQHLLLNGLKPIRGLHGVLDLGEGSGGESSNIPPVWTEVVAAGAEHWGWAACG
jgi:hypothetical protein